MNRDLLHKMRLHCNPLVSRYRGSSLGRNAINDRIAISRRWRFIYYRVPKAANSTIVRTLAAHDPELPFDAGWTAKRTKRQAYLAPTELGIRASFAARRRYDSFTFVRNPHTRLLSAYLDKIANPENPRSGRRTTRVRATVGDAPGLPVSFADFVEYLEAGGLHANIHWAPQTSLVPPDVRFIGRVETLEEDFGALIPRLFPGVEYRQSERWSPHGTGADSLLEQYYTEPLSAKVVELYRSDFDRFGYPA